ncbi:MAG: CAP domain-containing protein [Pseudomonadota bacterium]
MRIFWLISLFLGLAACTNPTFDAPAGQDVYSISQRDTADIQFRMLDSVNAIRSRAGVSQLSLSPELIAAAATHSRDMSLQNRPWHFGSDGSSPIDRVNRAGFNGTLVGETISETYETELETLAAWMDDPNTRGVILSPDANTLGIAWYQESTGKIWWTMVLGRQGLPRV